MEKTIKICKGHQHYKVPFVWTFAFPGAEYWCPYCGGAHGMLGAGEDVKETPLLKDRLKAYEKYTKKGRNAYLHAVGVTHCFQTLWRGKWIKYSELPEKETLRLEKIRAEWKYKKRIESLIK